jgi:hypothetical protein
MKITESLGVPQYPDSRLAFLSVMKEAGGNYSQYIEDLHRRFSVTPLSLKINGVAYLAATNGQPDPEERLFHRVCSFDDGIKLALRVGKDILGPNYTALLCRSIKTMNADDWKQTLENANLLQCRRQAEIYMEQAALGLDNYPEFTDIAETFNERMPYAESPDNLLMSGYGLGMYYVGRADNIIASIASRG